MSEEPSGQVWAAFKFFLLARGWFFALTVLAVSIAFLWFGDLAGRLIGAALLVGFVAIARGLGAKGFLRRRRIGS